MQDGVIECYKVLVEVEKYCILKADIRNQSKTKLKKITKEQREEMFEKGRKEGKVDYLRRIASTLGINGVNDI